MTVTHDQCAVDCTILGRNIVKLNCKSEEKSLKSFEKRKTSPMNNDYYQIERSHGERLTENYSHSRRRHVR